MENSCNWDMEFNNLSLKTIRKNLFYERNVSGENLMDISHHQTPKSNKVLSQRKLSESFRLFENDSDDEKPEYNQSKQMRFKLDEDCKTSKQEIEVLSQNTQDTGYNTCSELSQRTYSRQDDDMIVSDASIYNDKGGDWDINIYASTPTKKYFNFENVH